MGNAPDTKKYLTDVIDYERDIEPYRMVKIIAGVGAGKNYWVRQELIKRGHVLLITSRKATANQQAKGIDASRWIDLDELFRTGIGKLRGKHEHVVVTNAGIEKYVTEKYRADDEATHIYGCFDFIILDEAHSLSADATFAESPFYVEAFLRWACRNNPKCKLIFMTGTPEPIDWLFPEELKNHAKFNTIDCRKECNAVRPNEVYLAKKQNVPRIIFEQYRDNERIIYFAQRIARIIELRKTLIEMGIPSSDIGVSYSKDERDHDFPDDVIEAKKQIERSIVEQERIPDGVKILLTTSKNKEGVNILNDDIKIMFAESTEQAELVQMAGRIRAGIESLVILYDTNRRNEAQNEFKIELAEHCIGTIKEAVKDYCKDRSNPYLDPHLEWLSDKGIQDTIAEMSPYIRFDPFTKQYELYQGRIIGQRKQIADASCLAGYIEAWFDPCYLESAESEEQTTGEDEFQNWFPDSVVNPPFDDFDNAADARATVDEALSVLVGQTITKDERDQLRDKLNESLRQFMMKPVQHINTLLKKYGYTVAPKNNHGKEFIVKRLDGEKK